MTTQRVYNQPPQHTEFTNIEQLNRYYRVFTTQGVKTDNAIYRLRHRTSKADEQRMQIALMDSRLKAMAVRPIHSGSVIRLRQAAVTGPCTVTTGFEFT